MDSNWLAGDAHGADRGRRSTMSANTIYTEKRFTSAVQSPSQTASMNNHA
jgi:hypothetical protein